MTMAPTRPNPRSFAIAYEPINFNMPMRLATTIPNGSALLPSQLEPEFGLLDFEFTTRRVALSDTDVHSLSGTSHGA